MPSSSPPKPQGWKLTTYCFEPNNEETFDIAFCKVGKHVQDGLFCTVGGRYISIYLAKPDSTTMVHRFADSNESESYFCCTWLLDAATGDLLVAAAGLKACVKIVNCHTKRLHHHLVGHGNAINDLVRVRSVRRVGRPVCVLYAALTPTQLLFCASRLGTRWTTIYCSLRARMNQLGFGTFETEGFWCVHL